MDRQFTCELENGPLRGLLPQGEKSRSRSCAACVRKARLQALARMARPNPEQVTFVAPGINRCRS